VPIIYIDWFEGRDVDQKRALVKEITDSMVRIAKCKPEAVGIIFTEHPRTDIARGGVLFSDK